MRLFGLLVTIGIVASAALAAVPHADPSPGYVSDRECTACHLREAGSWRASKHAHAMQEASPQTVLGDFAGEHFVGRGEQAHFFKRDGEFFVRTAGPDGEDAEFPVTHTFGIHPLQQYLLPLGGGRLQALTVAWDTRQRKWFSLHPEGAFAPGSILHWSGRYQNWNLMCGECHTTAYRKGYEADRYRTTWAAMNVGCQACHGPGREHVASARRPFVDTNPKNASSSRDRAPTVVPMPNRALRQAHEQVDQCAACHARRTRLKELTVPGEPLLDHFMPDNLRADLYYADGQQFEEVFEYGSYRQSRMYQAGVACSDCHEPHSGRLLAQGNALCVRCHNAAPDPRFAGLIAKGYETPAHHFHQSGGAGSQCVDCHMPSRNYMVVHGRRDHAIRIPRPDLTARLGVPNACHDCHLDRPATWAAAAVERQFGRRDRPTHYGEVFAAARAGIPAAAAALMRVIESADQPAIVRATAVEQLAMFASAAIPDSALTDADPVVRASAAAALATRPARERLARLPALLDDPRRAVRITAARGLADLDDALFDADRRALRRDALGEFVGAQQAMADMPSAQLNLASLHLAQRNGAAAEQHYRRAVAQDPSFNAARIGLAELLAALKREDEAVSVLRAGLEKSVLPGELHFALGVLAGQRQRWHEAASELEAAARLMPGNARVRRNLEVVLRHLAPSQGTVQPESEQQAR